MAKEKSLITKEIAKLVQHEIQANPELTLYNFTGCDKFRIGKALIRRTIDPDKVRPVLTMFTGEEFGGDYAKAWYHDVGNVLCKELKKDEPLIFEYRCKLFNALLKEIRTDEFDEFLVNGFVHLKVCDKAYTIIKMTKPDDNYQAFDMNGDYGIDFFHKDDGECDDDRQIKKRGRKTEPEPEIVEPLIYDLF